MTSEDQPELPLENTPDLTRSIVYSLLGQGKTLADVAQHFNMKYHELREFMDAQELPLPKTQLAVLADCRDTRFGANTAVLYQDVLPTWKSCLVGATAESCFWCGVATANHVDVSRERGNGGIFGTVSDAVLSTDFAGCCKACAANLGHFVSVSHSFSIAATQTFLNFKTQGRLRGHDFTLRIALHLPVHRALGVAIDHETFRTMVENNVCSILRGSLSNVFPRSLNPTCENLVWWVWRQLVATSNVKGIQSVELSSPEYACVLERRDVVDYVLNNNVKGDSNEKAND